MSRRKREESKAEVDGKREKAEGAVTRKDKQTDRQTDRQKDRQNERQTDRRTLTNRIETKSDDWIGYTP